MTTLRHRIELLNASMHALARLHALLRQHAALGETGDEAYAVLAPDREALRTRFPEITALTCTETPPPVEMEEVALPPVPLSPESPVAWHAVIDWRTLCATCAGDEPLPAAVLLLTPTGAIRACAIRGIPREEASGWQTLADIDEAYGPGELIACPELDGVLCALTPSSPLAAPDRVLSRLSHAARINRLLAGGFMNTPLGLIISRVNGETLEVIYCNHTAEHIFGWSTEEMRGADLWACIPALSDTPLREWLMRLPDTEPTLNFTQTCTTGSATPLTMRWFNTCIPLPEVSGIYLVTLAEDMTERDATAHALERSRDYYLSLLAGVPAYTWISDAEGKCRYFNDRWLDFTGRCEADEKGHGWLADLHPDDRERFASTFQEAIGMRQPLEMECRLRRADGAYRWMRILAHPFDAMEGGFAGYIGSAYDITEHKRVEEHLRASERRFREMLESIESLAIMLDIEGRITFCNDYFLRCTGWQREEIIGRNWFDTFVPLDSTQEGITPDRMTAGDVPTHEEYPILTRTGAHLIIAWSRTLLRDHCGQVIGITSIGEDITLQRRSEEAIRRAKREWEITFDAVTELIAILDVRNRIVRANQALAAHLGIPLSALVGQTFQDVMRRGQPDVAFPKLTASHEVEWHDPATRRDFVIVRSPMHDAGSERMTSVVVAHDITESRQAKEALMVSEERYALVIQGIDGGVWDRDLRTNAMYFSPRWKTMLGYEDQDLPNAVEEWVTRIHPDDAASVMAALHEHLAGHTPYYTAEHRLRHRDGSYRWIHTRGVAVYDADGHPTRIVGSHTDITERKEAEEQVKHYQDELRSLATELLRSEAHERRRIAQGLHDHIGQMLALAHIQLGALQAGLASPATDAQCRQLRALLKEAIHATRNLTFELSPPILYELGLEPALEWLANRLQQQHGLSIDVTSNCLPDPLTEERRTFAFEVVRELILNTVKHAKATQARVKMLKSQHDVTISVTDDGIGFDVRAVLGYAAQRQGFGLFSVRERLRQIGGRLALVSGADNGTTATIRIPRE